MVSFFGFGRESRGCRATQATLIEIQLKGLLFADDPAEITRLDQIISSRFLHGRVHTSSLAPAPADENWVSGLPQGFLRSAGAKLREIADSDADAKRRFGRSACAARAVRDERGGAVMILRNIKVEGWGCFANSTEVRYFRATKRS